MNKRFAEIATHLKPEIILICKGEEIRPETIYFIKKRSDSIVINWYFDQKGEI
jgi:hypothetical protein